MKLTALFASAILTIGFIACGGEKDSAETTDTTAEQTTAQNEPQAQSAPETQPAQEAAAPELVNGVQVITVNVQDTGYIPAHIKFKAGVPAKIIFDQHGTTACAWDVKSPDLGIKLTKLPKDTKTEVTFTPGKSGTFAFTCGMDMLRGSIIVEEPETAKSM